MKDFMIRVWLNDAQAHELVQLTKGQNMISALEWGDDSHMIDERQMLESILASPLSKAALDSALVATRGDLARRWRELAWKRKGVKK